PAGTVPARTSSAIAEGTVLISRTSSRHEAVAVSNTSPARITRPPQAKGANSSNTERSKLIEVDASAPENSSALNTAPAQLTKQTALLCSMATPFGTPVDPDV